MHLLIPMIIDYSLNLFSYANSGFKSTFHSILCKSSLWYQCFLSYSIGSNTFFFQFFHQFIIINNHNLHSANNIHLFLCILYHSILIFSTIYNLIGFPLLTFPIPLCIIKFAIYSNISNRCILRFFHHIVSLSILPLFAFLLSP